MTNRITYIMSSEEGPTTGALANLPQGRQVWSGEISADLWRAQDGRTREFLNQTDDYGIFVVAASPGTFGVRVICRCADVDTGIAIVTALMRSPGLIDGFMLDSRS